MLDQVKVRYKEGNGYFGQQGCFKELRATDVGSAVASAQQLVKGAIANASIADIEIALIGAKGGKSASFALEVLGWLMPFAYLLTGPKGPYISTETPL